MPSNTTQALLRFLSEPTIVPEGKKFEKRKVSRLYQSTGTLK